MRGVGGSIRARGKPHRGTKDFQEKQEAETERLLPRTSAGSTVGERHNAPVPAPVRVLQKISRILRQRDSERKHGSQ